MAKNKPSKNWIANEVFKHLQKTFEDRILVTGKNRFFMVYLHDKGYWKLDLDDNIITSIIVEFLYTHGFKKDDRSDIFHLVQLDIKDYTIGKIHSHFCLYDLLTDAENDVKKFANNYRTFLVRYNRKDLSEMPMHSTEVIYNNKFYDEQKTQPVQYIVINMANGILRIDKRTHEMLFMGNHNMDSYFKNRIEVEYDMTANCPTWKSFLSSVVEKQEDIDLIRIYMAYCLLSHDFKWETALYIFGTGANGKGTLLRAFVEMFSNPAFTSISSLDNQFGGMGLIEKNFWWANEQDGDAINTELLKKIISGEEVEIHIKHKKPQIELLKMKLIVTANELPLLKKYAEKRRFLVVRFPHKFEGSDKDVDLDEKLIDELPGLLNWIIDAIPMYLKKKAQLSSGISTRYEQSYNELADPFKIFLEKFVTETGDNSDVIPTRSITRAYNAFAEKYKHEWMTTTVVGRRISAIYDHISRESLSHDEMDTEDGQLVNVTKRLRGFKGLKIDIQQIYDIRALWDTEKYDMDNNNRDIYSGLKEGSNLTRLDFVQLVFTELLESKQIDYVIGLGDEYGFTSTETKYIVKHLLKNGKIRHTPDGELEAVQW